MGARSEEKQIGDHLYKVTQLTVSKARPLLKRLSDTLLPVVGRALGDLDGGAASSVMDVSTAAIGSALQELPLRLSEADLKYVEEHLASSTLVKGEDGGWMKLSDIWEIHWIDRWDEWSLWLIFAVQVNYSSFLKSFGGAGAITSKVKELYPLSSPRDATGT